MSTVLLPSLPFAELFRFGVVGLLSLGTYLVFLNVLLHFTSTLWLAGTLAWMLSMSLNYALQRRVTFRSERAHAKAAPRYLTVNAVGVGINAATLEVGVTVLELRLALVQVVAVVLAALWSYLAQKIWVFSVARDKQRSVGA